MKRKGQAMRLAVILLCGMLIACVQQGKVRIVQDTKKKIPLSQQHGVIVARVINASPYSQTFNYLTLSPKNVFEKKKNKFERIESIKKLAGKTTVFATPLPAGDYSLADINSYHVYHYGNYTYYYQLQAAADPKFGTFKVEPGKITNLGTIIYYQKPDGDKYIQILARKDEFNDGLKFLEKEKPELYKQVDAAQALSWNEDDYAAERHDLYLNLVQNPVTFDTAYPQEDGSWYFPCKLGVLLQRTAQGKWDTDTLETDYDLMLLNQNPNGDKVIVDENGGIFFKGRKAKSWTAIAKPDTGDNISYAQLGDAGDIYVITTSPKNGLKIYSGKISGTPEWTVILSYTAYLGWRTPQDMAATDKKPKKVRKKTDMAPNFSAITLHAGKTLMAVDGTLYELELQPGQAIPTRIPTEFTLSAAERTAYNQLSVSRWNAFSGNIERQYSLDDGKTWLTFEERYDRCPDSKKIFNSRNKVSCPDGERRYRTRRHITTPVFFADGQGYSIISHVETAGGFFKPLERTTVYELVVSKDGGKTWFKSPGSELPKYCGGLRKGADEKTLLLSCEYSTGQFYKADRETLKWVIDYQPALF